MRLVFMSLHTVQKRRVLTPSTADLTLALRIKAQFMEINESNPRTMSGRALAEGGKLAAKLRSSSSSSQILDQLHRLKAEAANKIKQEKYDREMLEKSLLQAVNSELELRGEKAVVERNNQRQDDYKPGQHEEKDWQVHAEAALELRDMLALDHQGTCDAVARLKALSTERLAAARAVVLGHEISGVDSEDPEAAEPPSNRRRSSSSSTLALCPL
ncbi:unnamed protein product, partial [Polarella glacialis]